MLKKIGLIVGLIVVMTLSFAVAAAAAEEEAPQVAVYFDNELMEFEVDPFIENGSTQVPFRPIFEKLGLRIGWNEETKTVTGDKEGLSIQLQIGNKTAVVNGVEKQLNVAPVIKAGFTFIPVRFVIEHSDKDVTWHGRERVVYIADTADQVGFVYGKHFAYANREDIEGAMSTVDPTSPLYERTAETLSLVFDTYDLEIEHAEPVFTQLSENQAVLYANEVTRKLAGPEYKNNSIITNHLFLKTNGDWKLYMTRLLFIDYLKEDLLAEGEVTTSQADKQAIRDVFEASVVNAENEDNDAERSLHMADYPDLEQTLEAASQMFAVFDFEFKYSDFKFLSGTDKEVKVQYHMLMKRVSGLEFPDNITGFVATLKKDVDGKWKYASSETLNTDYRLDSIETFLEMNSK
jgi:hypothetical protein